MPHDPTPHQGCAHARTRPILRMALLVVPSLLLSLSATQTEAASSGTAARKTNILYIMADDLGYGELGCYGQDKIETPRIDSLARDGIRFTQHYSGAPVCAPARCVLLTGRHSGHATIRDNLEHKPEGQGPIHAEDVTLAEMLGAAGYVNGAFGKWGLGYPGSVGDPMNQGFDRFFGYNCQREAHNFYPRYLWSDREKVMLQGNDRGRTGAQYSHDLIAEEAKAFVRANADRPFFCYVPYTIPHLALQVPDDAIQRYAGRWEETPYEGNSYLPHETPRACYAAMISRMDDSVGELLDLLDELGLADDTLVIFTSDNGPTHLLPQVDVDFFHSAAGLRGLKGSVFEGGLRVPMVARWPGQIAPRTTSDHPSTFADVMATLADVADIEAPKNDGQSFLPALRGQEQPAPEFLFWDFPGYGGQIAVRTGNWKGVRRDLRRHPDAPWQLFDLAVDPGETKDVADAHLDVIARIDAIARRERTRPEYESFRFGEYAGE